MASQPISIHYKQMEEWLEDRKAVFSRKHKKEFNELLSIAPQLVQVAQYDIPAVEKQIKRNETAIEECHRVCDETQRTQLKLWERRSDVLKEYGVEVAAANGGVGVTSAVDQRVREACAKVNTAFREYTRACMKGFKLHYNAFLMRSAAGRYGADPFAFHFPWLQRAFSEVEYLPVDASSVATCANGEDTDVAAPHIDWGDDGDGAEGAVAGLAKAAVHISWDATEMEARLVEDDSLPATDGLHFSIDIGSAKHRVNVLAELEAAACFCRERGTADLLECAAETESLRDFLSNSKEGELARMRESYRTKSSLVDRIERFEHQIMVAKNRSVAHAAKMRDASDELEKFKVQHDELVSRLRSMRDEALTHLEHMFPERQILIVGDLNKYLA
ncbi:putative CDK5 regulatory subunit-associated protein 3 [Leishmania naiffi]|uniref:CDK5 regulatory subunit-associated protein 3 n=1 Tax=Leishmania naiffi TaxID=5678 RepID=A0AAW3BHV3_9TRYP